MGLRIARAERPLTDRWRTVPVESRGGTRLGISFRPLQAESLGLEPRATLAALLDHPYEVVRLAALWNRMEPAPGAFDPAHLDWQVESAERAGKQVIIAVGAVKNFGYPEFYVPGHHLPTPLRGRLAGRRVSLIRSCWRLRSSSCAGSWSDTPRTTRWSPGRSSTRRWIRSAWSTRGG